MGLQSPLLSEPLDRSCSLPPGFWHLSPWASCLNALPDYRWSFSLCRGKVFQPGCINITCCSVSLSRAASVPALLPTYSASQIRILNASHSIFLLVCYFLLLKLLPQPYLLLCLLVSAAFHVHMGLLSSSLFIYTPDALSIPFLLASLCRSQGAS